VHPRPTGCTDEVHGELLRCFSFHPETRPSFSELSQFFKAITPADVDAGTSASAEAPRSAASQTQHYLHVLHQHTHGDPAVFEELTEDGNITTDGTYSKDEYMQLGAQSKALIDRERRLTSGLDSLQISAKLVQAVEALESGAAKYRVKYEAWRSNASQNASLVKLKEVLSTAESKISCAQKDVNQPNPWDNDGISVHSKRYLTRMLAVYSGSGSQYDVLIDPVKEIKALCGRLVESFGTGVELVPGPAKKKARIMEKVRDGDGNYASVRDVGRLSLVVGDIVLLPDVVVALLDCADFEVTRIKNRLDPDNEKAGYRDVQLLVRELRGRWIVEIQVVPKEMYALKSTDGYTKYRFVFEACKRARVQRAAKAFKRGLSSSSMAGWSNGAGRAAVADAKGSDADDLVQHNPGRQDGATCDFLVVTNL